MSGTEKEHHPRVDPLRIILPASWWTIELRDAVVASIEPEEQP